ncbi:MAG: Holliday junction resolvase RuvX [Pirellulales bacterium]
MTDSVPSPNTLPKQGRLAGIDFGNARIGVSTCDPTQNFVTPLETYNRRNDRLDSQYFQQLATSEQLVGWVIGLPIHCDGKESQKSNEARSFAVWLTELTGLPHTFYDERFSSKEARVLMYDTGWTPKQKKKNVDRLAAYLILKHFLEARPNLNSAEQQAQLPLD